MSNFYETGHLVNGKDFNRLLVFLVAYHAHLLATYTHYTPTTILQSQTLDCKTL